MSSLELYTAPPQNRNQIYHCEPPSSYQPGGFSPIHLDDKLTSTTTSNTYRIAEKLSYDGLRTHWAVQDVASHRFYRLAIEKSSFSASSGAERVEILKQLMKEAPEGVDVPVDVFEYTGVNGRHLCIVGIAEVGSLFELYVEDLWDVESVVGKKMMVAQLARAVRWLHSKGIVHGAINDRTVKNTDHDVSGRGEDEFKRIYLDSEYPPSRQTFPVSRVDGQPVTDPNVPKYLVMPKFFVYDATDNPDGLLCDFAFSFHKDRPPADDPTKLSEYINIGVMPNNYLAPELLHLGHPRSFASDIWALGAVFYLILTDVSLFRDGTSKDSQLRDLVYLTKKAPCGPLKECLDRELLKHVEEEDWEGFWRQMEGEVGLRYEERGDSLDLFENLQKSRALEEEEPELWEGILKRMLAVDPEERYTADELVDALPKHWLDM